jgi:hypothetical protein
MPRKKSPKPSNRFSDPTILTAPAGVIWRVFFYNEPFQVSSPFSLISRSISWGWRAT